MKEYRTEKREELMNVFRSHPDTALTLEELCLAVGAGEHGKSTLYRNLARFVEEGTVRKISDGVSRHFTYQYIACADAERTVLHLHLRCEVCGKLYHLDRETTRLLAAGLKRNMRFSLDGKKTLLFGTCSRCIGKLG